jgi:hypothetical protein
MEPTTIVQIETPAMLSWAAGIMAVSLVGVASTLIALSRRVGEIKDMVVTVPMIAERVGVAAESERMLRVLMDSTTRHIAETDKVLTALNRLTEVISKDIEDRRRS